jgi:hypothetical protein
MCHRISILQTVSPAERESVRRWTSILVPAYACVALLLVAVALVAGAPRLDGIAIAVREVAPVSPR